MPQESDIPKIPEGLQELLENPVAPEGLKAIAQTILEINTILNRGVAIDNPTDSRHINREQLINEYERNIKIYDEEKDRWDKNPLSYNDSKGEGVLKSWRGVLVGKNAEWRHILMPEALRQVGQVVKGFYMIQNFQDSPLFAEAPRRNQSETYSDFDLRSKDFLSKNGANDYEQIRTYVLAELDKWCKDIHYTPADPPEEIKQSLVFLEKKLEENPTWQDFLQIKKPAYEAIYEIYNIIQPYQRHLQMEMEKAETQHDHDIDDLNKKIATVSEINKILTANETSVQKYENLKQYIADHETELDHLETDRGNSKFWNAIDAIRNDAIRKILGLKKTITEVTGATITESILPQESDIPKIPEGQLLEDVQKLLEDPVAPEGLKAIAQTILEINLILNRGSEPTEPEHMSREQLMTAYMKMKTIYKDQKRVWIEDILSYNNSPGKRALALWRRDAGKNAEWRHILMPEALRQAVQVVKELQMIQESPDSPLIAEAPQKNSSETSYDHALRFNKFFNEKGGEELKELRTYVLAEFDKWQQDIHYTPADSEKMKKISDSWRKKLKENPTWQDFLQKNKPAYESIYEIYNIIQPYQRHLEAAKLRGEKAEDLTQKIATVSEINKILTANKTSVQKYENLKEYIRDHKTELDRLETRRGNSKFWNVIDAIRKIFGFKKTITGVTGATITKSIYSHFNHPDTKSKEKVPDNNQINKKQPTKH